MCGTSFFKGETSAAFGQSRIGLGWQLLPALIVASAAYALTAPPAMSKTVDASAYDQSSAVNPLTSQSKPRDGLTLMIDPVAAEPEAENLQSQFAEFQVEHVKAPVLKRDKRVVGRASTYNPYKPGDCSGGKTTASGEPYEENGWAAAIQINLRRLFNGVRFGRNYRPTFALVTSGDKSAILKINDVGPLLPGRVIDLTERAMRYFDASFDRGVLSNVTVTPLVGERWRAGPVEGGPALSMAGDLLDDTVH
jgi:peptidoglycan lytic transglycosylase